MTSKFHPLGSAPLGRAGMTPTYYHLRATERRSNDLDEATRPSSTWDLGYRSLHITIAIADQQTLIHGWLAQLMHIRTAILKAWHTTEVPYSPEAFLVDTALHTELELQHKPQLLWEPMTSTLSISQLYLCRPLSTSSTPRWMSPDWADSCFPNALAWEPCPLPLDFPILSRA
jgi:hypothetical protein